MTALLSVGGNTYSKTDGPADELFFGSVDGVVQFRREGDRWQEVHRALQGLHVSSLAVEPRSGTMFAGTHNGSVHASADHGQTWEKRSSGVEQEEVYSLAVVDANGETRVYAGTEPAHLYVSTDLGKTWTDLPAVRNVSGIGEWTFPAPPHEAHVKYITIQPGQPDTLFACVEQGALLRSHDAGKTFDIIYQASATDAHRINVPPGRPDHLYLTRGDWSTGHEGIYLSKDDGASWERLFDRSLIGYPDATLIHPERPELIFVAGATGSPNAWGKMGQAGTHVARSRDGGRTWQTLGIPPAGVQGNIEAMTLNTWPGGAGIFAGTTDGDIYYSADEGESWTTILSGLPAISKAGHWTWRRRLAAA